jgi:hypothetical protein
MHAYAQAEDDRRSTAQKMVMEGELSADVFAEDLEELPDMEQDFADDFQEVRGGDCIRGEREGTGGEKMR